MYKMFCDKCGKEIDELTSKSVDVNLDDYETHFDFCEKCFNDIEEQICKILPM